MGQKVNPHGLRVGVIKDWDSRCFTEDFYENMNSKAKRQMEKDRIFRKSTGKAEIQCSYYSAEKHFISDGKRNMVRRVISSRQNC